MHLLLSALSSVRPIIAPATATGPGSVIDDLRARSPIFGQCQHFCPTTMTSDIRPYARCHRRKGIMVPRIRWDGYIGGLCQKVKIWTSLEIHSNSICNVHCLRFLQVILALGLARSDVRVFKWCELLLTTHSRRPCPQTTVALWMWARIALILTFAQ